MTDNCQERTKITSNTEFDGCLWFTHDKLQIIKKIRFRKFSFNCFTFVKHGYLYNKGISDLRSVRLMVFIFIGWF